MSMAGPGSWDLANARMADLRRDAERARLVAQSQHRRRAFWRPIRSLLMGMGRSSGASQPVMTGGDLPVDQASRAAVVRPGVIPPAATARELAIALGTREIDDLRTAQPGLAAAVAQLSLAAGKAWPISVDDPLVLLLRALARLSIECPEASSTYAAEVIARCRTTQRIDSSDR